MKHYKRLWQESPGAMTLLHVLVVGLAVSAAFVQRNPVVSLVALCVTGLMAACLAPGLRGVGHWEVKK